MTLHKIFLTYTKLNSSSHALLYKLDELSKLLVHNLFC